MSTIDTNQQLNYSKRKRKQLNISRKKRKHLNEEDSKSIEPASVPAIRDSSAPVIRSVKWTNKQRVMVCSSRGISYRDRHLMRDLISLLPHSKAESKQERKDDLLNLNEVAQVKNCNKCLYFVAKKKVDLYLWMANISEGPSIKFLVQNVHSLMELKLTGNSLKGTRPFLCFDKNFDHPHTALMKEMISQVFGAPLGHPKTQPFFDHVFVFSLIDGKIWFRNYQIVEEDGQLTEIGPRFVLTPIKILDGSFSGTTLWSNPKYVTPNVSRSNKNKVKASRYLEQVVQKKRSQSAVKFPLFADDTGDLFETKRPEEAEGLEKTLFVRKQSRKKKQFRRNK